MNRKAGEDTEDLAFLQTAVLEKLTESEKKPDDSFLAETTVLERLTSQQAKNNERLTETQVFERMTDDGQPKEEKKPQQEEKSTAAREVVLFFRDLAISLAAVLIVVNFIFRPIQVKGSSMYPTLSGGQFGVSNLIGYTTSGVKRFDIVIIYMDDKNEYLVKRCVGLPGETISYQEGILYVNGEPVEENFFDESYVSSFDVFMEDLDEITLGENEYFCLGDNRPHSTDSRYYGPFTDEQIISKGVFIFYPFSSFGVKSW